ncbi:uncharacterized protein EAF01_001755 [Botrytis porri]|uniref:uncharacterized protein n=1 Tax=Botrytis porri TaxID=87229 RepID=UPI001901C8BD|nr:uncharacterized protein EAF01_001755 [Botrytis porri]KAF7912734.1 hypothetical protein EAF01_001755 [Botrytis porri]
MRQMIRILDNPNVKTCLLADATGLGMIIKSSDSEHGVDTALTTLPDSHPASFLRFTVKFVDNGSPEKTRT